MDVKRLSHTHKVIQAKEALNVCDDNDDANGALDFETG